MSGTAEIDDVATAKHLWTVRDLPPYRPVARKLMLLTTRENVPLSEVQEVLRTDAAFAADVLRLANSPLIGMRGEITSIMQAVMLLGLERIKALATTLSLRAFLTGGDPSGVLRQSWRHNLAAAILCQRLARLVHLDSDTCYTAGLLHDIGRLAFLRTCRKKYELVLAQSRDSDFDLLQREKSIFGIDHCEAGASILEQWGFPQELREAVLLHHRRPQPGASGLLPVVYAGWQIADALGFSTVKNESACGDIAEIAAVLPAGARRQLGEEFDGLAEEVAFKINAIECSLV